MQRCHNSSSSGHTIYSHHLVHNLSFILSSVASPSLSFPLPSSLPSISVKMRVYESQNEFILKNKQINKKFKKREREKKKNGEEGNTFPVPK